MSSFRPPKPAFKPQNGMYPGSGVAPGGQLGRPTALHGGVTGVRPGGGPTIGASQPRPQVPGLPQRPAVQVQVPQLPQMNPAHAAMLAQLLGQRPAPAPMIHAPRVI